MYALAQIKVKKLWNQKGCQILCAHKPCMFSHIGSLISKLLINCCNHTGIYTVKENQPFKGYLRIATEKWTIPYQIGIDDFKNWKKQTAIKTTTVQGCSMTYSISYITM